jgi:hypothetical protein
MKPALLTLFLGNSAVASCLTKREEKLKKKQEEEDLYTREEDEFMRD